MRPRIRVLNVEDSEDDALLLLRHLKRAGYDVTFERVDTPEAMERALEGGTWDIVVTDYVMPHFSAPAAVALLKERNPDLPVIILSGVVGQETLAGETLRAGARDYLAKANISRLLPIIGLAAGVLPPSERSAAHLILCKEYQQLPDPNLVKAALHGEQAIAGAEAAGANHLLVGALLHLGTCYAAQGRLAEACGILQRFDTLRDRLSGSDAVLEGEIKLQLGLVMERMSEYAGARAALARAATVFGEMGLEARAAECTAHKLRLESQSGQEDGAHPPEVEGPDEWSARLQKAQYYLVAGDPVQSVREAIAALHLAGNHSERCYRSYMVLMSCARSQGHMRDALSFSLSARMMALDAQRQDLAFEATAAFTELYGTLGDEGRAVLKRLEQEYRELGLDIYEYLPASIRAERK